MGKSQSAGSKRCHKTQEVMQVLQPIIIFILILSDSAISDDCDSYHANHLCNATLSDPKFLKTTSDRVIHLGVSLRIIDKNNNRESESDFESGFKNDIKTLFTSILRLSSGATQHWIILTDKKSKGSVSIVLRQLLTKHVSENIIKTYVGRRNIRRVPKVIIDYIDLDELPNNDDDREFIKAIKFFLASDMGGTQKYVDDLFYMGPLYHKIFPSLNKLIFLDVDMEFQSDIKLLYQQFSQFSESNLIGVGNDLSPHYRLNLEQYRRWFPETTLGDPGWSQGLNTGVVLYNLERMRQSSTWESLLQPEKVFDLMRTYGYHVTLGDQDWFTNVGFENRDLYYRLPCQFNSQVSVQYWRPPFEENFMEYHHCEKPYHVIHKNGCGPDKATCDEVLRKAGVLKDHEENDKELNVTTKSEL